MAEYERLVSRPTVDDLQRQRYKAGCPQELAASAFMDTLNLTRSNELGHVAYCLAQALDVWAAETEKQR